MPIYKTQLLGFAGSSYGQDFDETKLLAEQGDADAQYNLGLMYLLGDGVPENDAEAVKWYRLAAEQGNATAQYNLGNMYDLGDGVPQSNVSAYVWYSVAATQGHETAKSLRDRVSKMLTPTQLGQAQQIATKCFGHGTFTYANGDTYVGDGKDDERNGHGTFTSANGDTYVGGWKDDERKGHGTFTSANGNTYVGGWKDDEQNGHGTYTFADGGSYVGEWKDGVKHFSQPLSAKKAPITIASPMLNVCRGCKLEIELFKMRTVDKGFYCNDCYPKFKALNQTELSDE